MILEFRRLRSLPKLSWCACVRRGEPEVRALLGEGIETRGNAFVEGAWSGDFAEFGFDEAETLIGSGCRVRETKVRFVSASHPLERIYMMRLDESLLVSNSLPFLLEQGEDGLDLGYPEYSFDCLAAFRRGVLGEPLRLQTARGRRVEAVTDGFVEVDERLAASVCPRRHGDPPRDFGELHKMLASAVERVCGNATSPARERGVYPAIAQLSKGYDSTAAAALAVRYGGCREAATFVGSSAKSGELVDDSGVETARELGIDISKHDRHDLSNLPLEVEAEFFLCPLARGDMSTAVMEDRLRGRLFTSGRNAERYWTDGAQQAGMGFAELADMGLAGLGTSEFRLRAGCLHFPVPYVGAFDSKALQGVAASEEMAPWRTGGRQYQRPIARRIAEEAGVPRESFGQKKVGGAGARLRPLRAETEQALREFVEARVPETVRRRLRFSPMGTGARNHFRAYRLRGLLCSMPRLRGLLERANLDRFHMLYRSIYQYFFHWGVAVVQERYRDDAARAWLCGD